MKETTRIARGASALFSSNLASNIISYGFYIFIVHFLVVGSLGVLYSLNVVSGLLASFLLLQLPGGFGRFITGRVQTGRMNEARYYFRSGLYFALAISAVSAPTLVVLSPLIAKWLFGSSSHLGLVYLVILDFVFYVFNSFLGLSLSSRRLFGRSSIIGVTSSAVRYGLGAVLILLGFGVAGVLYGWIASDILFLVAYLRYAKPFLKGEKTKQNLKEVVSYSLPLFLAAGAVVVLQNVDRLFVLKYLGLVQLGIYGSILIAANIPKILPSSVGSALMPAIIKFEDQDRLSPNIIMKSIRYITMLTVPTLGLLAAVAKPVIRILLGATFTPAWVSFSVLMLGSGAMSLDIPVTQVLSAKKKTKVLAVQQLVSSAVLAALAILLIPKLYVTGAALAYVLARISGFAVTSRAVYKLGLLKVDLRDYAKTLAMTAAAMVPTLLVEVQLRFAWYLLPLFLLVGVASAIVVEKFLKLFKDEDYEAVVDVFPSRIRWLASAIWKKLRLPVPAYT